MCNTGRVSLAWVLSQLFERAMLSVLCNSRKEVQNRVLSQGSEKAKGKRETLPNYVAQTNQSTINTVIINHLLQYTSILRTQYTSQGALAQTHLNVCASQDIISGISSQSFNISNHRYQSFRGCSEMIESWM